MPRPENPKTLPGKSGPNGYVIDEQVGFLLRIALQRHTSIFGQRMIEQLTTTQFGALAKLREVGPCSQNHLGRLIYLDAATIKGVVDRLSVRGFVASDSDQSDRRRREITLTERGREVIEAAVKIGVEITEETLAPLTPEERRTAIELLRKLG